MLNWSNTNGSVIKCWAFKRWNDHCFVPSSSDVHHTMTTKFPASIMALCEVASEGNVLNYFFTKLTKVNTEVCSKVLADKIIHWMKDKAARGKYVFQQDLYQAHVAKKTVNLLKVSKGRFWVKDLWLSNSPDYYSWLQIDAKECERHHKCVTAL